MNVASPTGVVAIADLGIHHLIAGEVEAARWIGSRHASSAIRVAVALAHDRPVAVLGSAGGDDNGEALVRHLSNHGVDVTVRRHGEQTRQAFQLQNPPPQPLFPVNRPVLTGRCPVCGVRQSGSRAARLEAEAWLAEHVRERRQSVFVFDRLSDGRRRIAADVRGSGSAGVLLLQRPEPMRFLPAVRLVAALDAFDLVVLGWRVVRTLERRLRLQGIEELVRAAGCPNLIAMESSHVAHLALDRGRVVETMTVRDGGLEAEERTEAILRYAVREWHPGMSLMERETRLRSAIHGAQRGEGEGPMVALPRLRQGVMLDELRANLDRTARCPLCLVEPSVAAHRAARQAARPGGRANVGWLMRRAFSAVERPEALAGVRELLKIPGTAYCVGSGGSYPVAAFAAQALLGHGELFAQPIRPMDYVRTARETDVVLVVSYSGATPDAGAVIERARELGVGRIVLLCAPGKPALGELLRPRAGDLLLSYGNPRRGGGGERGFVSIAATISPCVLLTSAIVSAQEIAELARDLPGAVERDETVSLRISEAVLADAPLAVFGGGAAWPPMLDIESKWAEADLGPLALHEVKDFSHGRFISVLGGMTRHQPLLLSVGGLTEYERLLFDVLGDLSPQLLTTRRAGLLGALELLIRCQFVSERVARHLHRDISRPEHIPDEGLRLYRWKGSLQADAAAALEPRD